VLSHERRDLLVLCEASFVCPVVWLSLLSYAWGRGLVDKASERPCFVSISDRLLLYTQLIPPSKCDSFQNKFRL